MMIRVIDYVGNGGGGVRFVMEMLKAMKKRRSSVEIELISYGNALKLYRSLAESEGIEFKITAMMPWAGWRERRSKVFGIRGTLQLFRALGLAGAWYYDVPETVVSGVDIVWFPWVHGHRMLGPLTPSVIGSFHDVIIFQFDDIVPNNIRADEKKSLQHWMASNAQMVVSSHYTATVAAQMFGVETKRFSMIPLSGDHAQVDTDASLPSDWQWINEPFLFYPANTSPHKNHEVLLKGVSAWGAKYPLVLTGSGTNLLGWGWGWGRGRRRGSKLWHLANSKGFKIGKSLIPLGYVTNGVYYAILKRVRALVIPTLAEGGGSFPVMEAMRCGIPVLASDIPVLREQIRRTGGEVLWFNPFDSMDLAAKLTEFENNHQRYKAQAIEQSVTLPCRSWEAVLDEYWKLFEKAVGRNICH